MEEIRKYKFREVRGGPRKLDAAQRAVGAPTSRRTTGRSGCWRSGTSSLTARRFDYGFNSGGALFGWTVEDAPSLIETSLVDQHGKSSLLPGSHRTG
jgi:hypothetical protein